MNVKIGVVLSILIERSDVAMTQSASHHHPKLLFLMGSQ